MKFVFRITIVLIAFLFVPLIHSQDIQILTGQMTKYEPVGTDDIDIYFGVVNISGIDSIAIFEVRTINDVPDGWSSSMCFGELCFAPNVDSVATTPQFFTPPIAAGDTLSTSIHVYTDFVSIGTAHIQIEVGTFRNPDDRYVLNFIATTDPTVDVKEKNIVNTYSLKQNFPNPFNPSTKIIYSLSEAGFVQLKVYNILGVEVATLVNEYKYSGNYSSDFDASKLSSGVYLYKLSVNNFNQTRKMILEK